MLPKDNRVIETCRSVLKRFNAFDAALSPICHLLALLGAHHILHVSWIRVNVNCRILKTIYVYLLMCYLNNLITFQYTK